ncbi:hypothetical protein LCGC14_0235120 [marine sediment metagenome]|uniref:Uncharacterized protein n=1 Tax=marine sediment metagenome TaxID=412755 RepID=A0A0F9WTN1_9ZZZZ
MTKTVKGKVVKNVKLPTVKAHKEYVVLYYDQHDEWDVDTALTTVKKEAERDAEEFLSEDTGIRVALVVEISLPAIE